MCPKGPICEGNVNTMDCKTPTEAQGQHIADQTSVVSMPATRQNVGGVCMSSEAVWAEM